MSSGVSPRATPPATSGRPIDRAWTAAAVLVPVVVALAARLSTVDLAYHLRLGEQIRSERAIPSSDTFTFTRFGSEWVDQQWGAQLVLESVDRLGGWSALVVLRAVLVGVSFALVFSVCRSRGVSARTASALTLASFVVGSAGLALRPQLLALPLVCVSLWIVTTRHRGCRRLVALPIVTWVCATFHGAFLVILVLLLIATIDAWGRRSPDRTLVLAASLSSFVVTFLTPLGADLWSSALGTTTDTALRELVTEWQPATLTQIGGWLLLGSVVGVGVVLWRSPRMWPHLLMSLPFLVLAVSVQRALLWWAIVAPAAVAPLLATASVDNGAGAESHVGIEVSSPAESRVPANVVIVVLIVVAVIALPFHRSDSLLSDAPAALADAVDDLPRGSRVFAHQPWASWLEQQAPAALQFVDSRFLVDDTIVVDYLTVAHGTTGWREVLDRWAVDAVAAPPDWPIVDDLRADPAWVSAQDDSESVLFVRVP